ncbi:hypothetical protein BT96DRAFT_632792 [Gymnopus androsaceus JB14]|uniref:Uncharacterized protein n=1 Tax=Gymnopus androsaceus JB14 TaxID=1447944 RepID=A0A6A4HT44_9AGAR|nr:hypothetical protein BT96DRAFT_497287 [Gymnopus androsaceus JB14]KAE9400900.1 hypothetical protein BT96DRAFT_632792 [Gymnopus androsaceus JB14]
MCRLVSISSLEFCGSELDASQTLENNSLAGAPYLSPRSHSNWTRFLNIPNKLALVQLNLSYSYSKNDIQHQHVRSELLSVAQAVILGVG